MNNYTNRNFIILSLLCLSIILVILNLPFIILIILILSLIWFFLNLFYRENFYGQDTNYPNRVGCYYDEQCASGACARPTANAQNKICCPSGKSDEYRWHRYCTGMPPKTKCWKDSQCANGTCISSSMYYPGFCN